MSDNHARHDYGTTLSMNVSHARKCRDAGEECYVLRGRCHVCPFELKYCQHLW